MREKGCGYRPGTLNVQVNGMQIEDLYQEWKAREKKILELCEAKAQMSFQLKEQGKLIKQLKEELAKYEGET